MTCPTHNHAETKKEIRHGEATFCLAAGALCWSLMLQSEMAVSQKKGGPQYRPQNITTLPHHHHRDHKELPLILGKAPKVLLAGAGRIAGQGSGPQNKIEMSCEVPLTGL